MGHLVNYNFRKNKGFPKKMADIPGGGSGAGQVVFQNIMLRKRRNSDLAQPAGVFTQGFNSANDIPSITNNGSGGDWNSTHGYANLFRHVPVPLGIYHLASGQNVGCLDCGMPGTNDPQTNSAWRVSKGVNPNPGTIYQRDISGQWNVGAPGAPQFMNFNTTNNSVGAVWASYNGQYIWKWIPSGSGVPIADAIYIGYMGQVAFNDGYLGCNANGTDDCTADSWLIRFNMPTNTAQYGRCAVFFFGVQEYTNGSDQNGLNTCVPVGQPGWDEGAIWPMSIQQSGQQGC